MATGFRATYLDWLSGTLVTGYSSLWARFLEAMSRPGWALSNGQCSYRGILKSNATFELRKTSIHLASILLGALKLQHCLLSK